MKRTIKLLNDIGVVDNLQKTINMSIKIFKVDTNDGDTRAALKYCVMRIIDEKNKIKEFIDATIDDVLDELDLKVDKDYESSAGELFVSALVESLMKILK